MIRQFDTGATRDTDEGKFDYEGFLSPLALEAFAAYMHEHRKQSDGKLRDSDNWQKGIPRAAYMKSLFRHFMTVWKLYRGYSVKPEKIGGELRVPTMREALCGLLFNVQGLLHHECQEKPKEEKPQGAVSPGRCCVCSSVVYAGERHWKLNPDRPDDITCAPCKRLIELGQLK